MNSLVSAIASSTVFCVVLALPAVSQQGPPPTSIPLDQTVTPIFKKGEIAEQIKTEKAFSNFRMFLHYDAEEASWLDFRDGHGIELPAGKGRKVEVAYEHTGSDPAHLRTWVDGKAIIKSKDLDGTVQGGKLMVASAEDSEKVFKMDSDFTAMVKFKAEKNGGTLIAKALPNGKWPKGGKALFVSKGQLVYDIGFLGAVKGKVKLKANRDYVAVVVSKANQIQLFVDGKLVGSREKFVAPDPKGSVFKVGAAAQDFGGNFNGEISGVRFWTRALNGKEINQLSKGNADAVNTPDLNWRPESKGAAGEEMKFGEIPGHAIQPLLEPGKGLVMHRAFMQPLEKADHAALVGGWNEESFHRGREIYGQLCATCHGTLDAPGSLPTAPRFHMGDFKNGADPYRMFQTLEKGYGQMVAQQQYTTAQKYDVIHYLRENFLKDRNKDQLVPVDEEYLGLLPRGMTTEEENKAAKRKPQYLLQDFGDTLFWTLQVEPGNIAQKGIAIRVDEGPGGISKGKAWMLYEHDTMRLAACWSGDEFVDWRGIAFDGSHGTHTSIAGRKHFVSPDQPMWANPKTGAFEDLRISGRDGKPYGPLPKEWVHFIGLEIHGEEPVIRYSVGDCQIREVPRLAGDGAFERWFYCGPSSNEMKLRLDAENIHTVPASSEPFVFGVRIHEGKAVAVNGGNAPKAPDDPASKRFEGRVVTEIERGEPQGAWAVDVLQTPAPDDNPWQSWMRTSGFDFFEGGKSAAVCTWNGDVWIVDGINQSEGKLKWQRICSGLFQPLGLKILDGEIYVSCRDMIAILRDTNGDRETDYIENFNSDHQVTEHFHEFAMGLQSDKEGNLYYAKSARHAKTAVVPHHGTLLKVSKDGSSTEILATGFRAANGICMNPDGSFMVTDQEGNWNPKNRINWVTTDKKGSDNFYGNMWGYHSITDEADAAMRQPLTWITNSYDRSPAELLWVPENSAWKPLRGSLLNLSYGAGRIYTVPFEKTSGGVQGGMSGFPIELFPTGVMRGRFSPDDGQLYSCGMFAWAGNRQEPGGFFRVRHTGQPAHQPVALTTSPSTVTIGFSDPIDPASAEDLSAWNIRAWDLKRTKRYGSQHFNEREWKVSKAEASKDGKSVILTVPDLAPTWGMSITMKLRGANGEEVVRDIHNSIYTLE
ncbi:MAG: DUF6797 domain-containing protein [Akkermansiaceae bacterium]